jgi:hypothetical protein
MGIVSGRDPYDGLRYPNADEKPPFQTRTEISRDLAGLTLGQAEELWKADYLTLPEIERLLAHVEGNALHPWIHSLLATAAHRRTQGRAAPDAGRRGGLCGGTCREP